MTLTAASLNRNRVKIFDAGFIVIILAVLTLFAVEVDVFRNPPGVGPQARVIEMDEFFVLTTVLMCGILLYTWRRAREHQRENTLRLAAEKEVLTLALQDPLTGLPNRRKFDEALKAAMDTLPTAPEAHAILVLDLNGFKKVNDVHGHPTGDHLLILVGARLLRAVREGDLVARIGGDEFVVLARNIGGPEEAASIALRIIDSLAAPIEIGAGRHQVGVGIGIALAPKNGCEADELFRKADLALYRAKAEHSSAMRFFEEEMDQFVQERAAMELALLEGLERGEFYLKYQPARLGDGRITGFEALPRWRHPTKGELEPERFLPLAAEARVLDRLTERFLREACAAAVGWPADVRLSFNLPNAILLDPPFAQRILAVLDEAGLAPRRLQLEADEGALVREAASARRLFEPLRAAGIAVIADHFGTGYSDLHNLHRLKLDGIKIDRSYISTMTQDHRAAAMVRALIGIGQGLELTITADGVGTEQQRRALQEQGCDQGQGLLFGQDLTAQEALSELSRGAPAA